MNSKRNAGIEGHSNRKYFYTPAPDLPEVLCMAGADLPGYIPRKTNLTHVNPLTPPSQRTKRRKAVANGPLRATRYSLRAITALFIYHCNKIGAFRGPPCRDNKDTIWKTDKEMRVISLVFDKHVEAYLALRQCSPEDVMTWAWILTAKDGRAAGLKLEAVVNSIEDSNARRLLLPPFLIMSILQRKDLPRSTLRMLLPLSRGLFEVDNPMRITDYKSTILLSIRLLRHFRKTWAEGLTQAVDIIIDNLFPSGTTEQLPPWATHTFNRLLLLIALPTSDGPFRNVELLQQCQFNLLQKMSTLGTPITREGFRAIISVQIANKKTTQEADHVRGMGRNWPPWSTERDGWHASHRGAYEGVVSRGGQMIQQMVEAGYGLTTWDEEATVLSGKDTDRTPTVQTRGFWKHGGSEEKALIWAVRIRATRTIDEAWWNFCECSAIGSVPHLSIWEEMFEKTIMAERLARKMLKENIIRKMVLEQSYVSREDIWLREQMNQQRQVVPGDGKELIPPPLNPKSGIFNRERPPDVQGLFSVMSQQGVRPGNNLTALLIAQPASTKFVGDVLQHWDPEQARILSIWDSELAINQPCNLGPSDKPINNKVITAFLTRLCRMLQTFKALHLLCQQRPIYRPAWNAVIEGFTNRLNPRSMTGPRKPHVDCRIIGGVWTTFIEMRQLVDLDNETLRLLSIACERWVTLRLDAVKWGGQPPLKRVIVLVFENIGVGEAEGVTSMIAPRPEMLHAFVRAMGLARRYDEMERLLVHLETRRVPLEGKVGRQVLYAARLFLEGAGYGVPEGRREVAEEGWAVIDRLTPMVERTWGGWGEVHELEKYLILGGLVRGRRPEELVVVEDRQGGDGEVAEDI